MKLENLLVETLETWSFHSYNTGGNITRHVYQMMENNISTFVPLLSNILWDYGQTVGITSSPNPSFSFGGIACDSTGRYVYITSNGLSNGNYMWITNYGLSFFHVPYIRID